MGRKESSSGKTGCVRHHYSRFRVEVTLDGKCEKGPGRTREADADADLALVCIAVSVLVRKAPGCRPSANILRAHGVRT